MYMAYKFIGKIKTLHSDDNGKGKATFFYSEKFKWNGEDYGIAYAVSEKDCEKGIIDTTHLEKDQTFTVKRPLLCFLSQHSAEQLIIEINEDKTAIIGVALSYE